MFRSKICSYSESLELWTIGNFVTMSENLRADRYGLRANKWFGLVDNELISLIEFIEFPNSSSDVQQSVKPNK